MTRNEEVATRYMAGATMAEIGKDIGVTRERVRQILDQQGVKRRSRSSAHQNTVSKIVAANKDVINGSFNKEMNIKAVVSQYKGVIPAHIIRDVLSPRKNEQNLPQNRGAVRMFQDEQIIAAIQEAEIAGATSTQSYSKWRKTESLSGRKLPSVATITVRYGTWSTARKKAGASIVRSRNSNSCRIFSDVDIESAVRRFVSAAGTKGVNPSARAYDEWARRVGNAPLLSTVRARTGRKWSSLTYRPKKV